MANQEDLANLLETAEKAFNSQSIDFSTFDNLQSSILHKITFEGIENNTRLMVFHAEKAKSYTDIILQCIRTNKTLILSQYFKCLGVRANGILECTHKYSGPNTVENGIEIMSYMLEQKKYGMLIYLFNYNPTIFSKSAINLYKHFQANDTSKLTSQYKLVLTELVKHHRMKELEANNKQQAEIIKTQSKELTTIRGDNDWLQERLTEVEERYTKMSAVLAEERQKSSGLTIENIKLLESQLDAAQPAFVIGAGNNDYYWQVQQVRNELNKIQLTITQPNTSQ